MARSLTVKHEESRRFNWLFAGFLMVAVGWLMLSTITSADAEVAAVATTPAAQ